MRSGYPLTLLLLLSWLGSVPSSALAQTVTRCENGFAGEYPCDRVDLLAHLDIVALGSSYDQPKDNTWRWGSDLWGWTDPSTGTEYALVGLWEGIAFVNLANPAAPVFVGLLPTATGRGNTSAVGNLWRDVKTVGNHAYVVSEARDHGMQVFDLRRLRSVSGPPVEFEADARYADVASAHNIVAVEGLDLVAIVGSNSDVCGSGLHLVDVSEPMEPRFAGCYDEAGYVHDAQCLVYDGPDPDYAGQPLCFSMTFGGASSAAGLSISDISDSENVVGVGEATYPTTRLPHQGWLTDDRRYFIVGDEGDEGGPDVPGTRTIILNVEDLDAPFYAGEYIAPITTIDHNLYISGDLVFQANYESGFRLYRLPEGSPAAFMAEGFFDTYPESDAFSFSGAWSAYPFFESGIVIVSDTERGLFVLQPAVTTVENESGPDEDNAGLSPAYPNPFRGTTTLTFVPASTERVRAEAFDLLGRRVAILFDGEAAAGTTVPITFDGTQWPTGTYVIQVIGESFAEASRVTLTR